MSVAKPIRSLLLELVILTGLLAWVAHEALGNSPSASPWRIVEGNGYTVCERFLANLNAFPASDPVTVCDVRIHPSHPEFTLPQWQAMDVQANLPLVYAAEMQLWTITLIGSRHPTFEEWRDKFEARIKNEKITPRLSKLVFTLGERSPETLISYQPDVGRCERDLAKYGVASTSGGHKFVLRESQSRPLEPFPTALGTQDQNVVVIYQGRPFFIGAWHDSMSGPIWYFRLDPLSVFTPDQVQPIPFWVQRRCAFVRPRTVRPGQF